MREGISIVNMNVRKLTKDDCDFSLPDNCYFVHPVIMLNSKLSPRPFGRVVEVSGDKTIREAFCDRGFRLYDGRVLNAKVLPDDINKNPMEYGFRAYNDFSNVIVPDDIKLGHLSRRCKEIGDFYKTDMLPVGAAPRKDIESLIDLHCRKIDRVI